MRLLNLGCGSRFHKDWINIDFVSNTEHVIAHNLLNGIPFENNSMDTVYHSHVLEHFSKKDGFAFIEECYRVLKTNGVIRIAVPDLETIAKEYLKNLQLATTGNEQAKYNYEWIVLELFDQMVRNKSGGEMKSYLCQPKIPNENYVFSRIGMEAKKIRESFLLSNKKKLANFSKVKKEKTIKNRLIKIKNRIKNISLGISVNRLTPNQKKALDIGQFKLSGEIHQWMYDRYSLTQVLDQIGFKDVKICTAFNSSIINWESYHLDVIAGEVRKPDSLFIEAKKP